MLDRTSSRLWASAHAAQVKQGGRFGLARRALLLIVVAFALGGGAWWWWFLRVPPDTAWQGYAEADFVKVGPTQQGLLTAVLVRRGDQVVLGTPLFTQDEAQDRDARDQAARQLAQAQEQLANLQSGGKPTEITQAEANLADAIAALARTEADFQRSETLMRTGAGSVQNFDQMRAAFLSAKAKVASMQAALEQLRAPMGRAREIEAQRDAVEAAQAGLAMTQWRLDQRRVASPVAGRVADVIAFAGETLAAGAPVVSILPPDNIFVRFFVPEGELADIHRGDRVSFHCDDCPSDFPGTISFISPQAEYTPPVIYSESSRSKLVYLVEARPRPDQARLLNPGEPVEVTPAQATRDVPVRH